ncbi:MAG: GTP cyclohydrolase I FolE [Helicobacteraceae bacterium]|jgi:GTP cyclohydrolase I|nr:GTP cyclohydrolase I FolE [Helicobacteraceae bacterium]
MNKDALKNLIKSMLVEIGEDPDRNGLLRTPERLANAFEFMLSGYRQDPAKVLGDALFDSQSKQMVLIRDIHFYSLCEHHMLPFFGRCAVGYIPNGKVVGISKVPRMVDIFARRLQIQERFTEEIADAVMQTIQPLGVAAIVTARHLCVEMRGVEKQGAVTTTSALRGIFLKDQKTREEFMSLVTVPPHDKL